MVESDLQKLSPPDFSNLSEVQAYFKNAKWTSDYQCGDFATDVLKLVFNQNILFNQNATPLIKTELHHGAIALMAGHVGVAFQHINQFYILHLLPSGLHVNSVDTLKIEGFYATTNQNPSSHKTENLH